MDAERYRPDPKHDGPARIGGDISVRVAKADILHAGDTFRSAVGTHENVAAPKRQGRSLEETVRAKPTAAPRGPS